MHILESVKIDGLAKSRKTVTPAKAGVHNILECLDSRFRGNDTKEAKRTFYERIKIDGLPKIRQWNGKV